MSRPSHRAVARLREAVLRPALPARYQLIEIIGRGGMGVVWRARDAELDRDVAVKVLAEHLDGVAFERRLRNEARILARLEHPGIVAVHDAGTLNDGRGWYVMRLVRGERLDVAAARFDTVGEALRIVERLCETVAYAHAQGVVHADLKPANVMLGPFGEVLVMDWGVARAARPDAEADASHGAVVGTPAYMAPEQAAGRPADARSDVYGLGAILGELLAGREADVPRPLAAIRDRAIAPEPALRYDGPLALATDLRRFQDGEPVSAYRERIWERAARIAGQYRTPIALVTAYLIMRMAILLWRGI